MDPLKLCKCSSGGNFLSALSARVLSNKVHNWTSILSNLDCFSFELDFLLIIIIASIYKTHMAFVSLNLHEKSMR